VLGGCSILVLWLFGGSISALIPLYAFGVFSAFTFSQAGMVVRWWKRREPTWQTGIVFNGIGALATLVVLLVVATTKFLDGAWLAVILLPIEITVFRLIHRHYESANQELTPETPIDQADITHRIIVPISCLNQVALQTLAYAQSIAHNPSDTVTVVHVSDDPEEVAELQRAWEAWRCGVPLVIIDSPYRSLVGPLLAFVDSVRERDPRATVSVVLPEFVPRHWWEHLLHNQTALRIKGALLFRPGVVVTSVPYHLRPTARPARERPEEPHTLAEMPPTEPAFHRPRQPRVIRPNRPNAS